MTPRIGDRYGQVVIVEIIKRTRGYRVRLQCDCGAQVTDRWYEVQRGRRKTCGCLKRGYRKDRLTSDGYRVVWHNGKRILEHRWVMGQHLGRPLAREEIVHHVNGDKLDNRVDNLAVMNMSEHSRHHAMQERRIAVLQCENARLREYIADLTHPG